MWGKGESGRGSEIERRYTNSIIYLKSISEFTFYIKLIFIFQLSIFEVKNCKMFIIHRFQRTDKLDNS